MKESAAASHIRLEAARSNVHLWRNNSGVLKNEQGTPVRYGLMNESSALNEKIKSSDYVGITPINAYVEGIGWTVLGVFTAIEMKHSKWRFNPLDKKELAQEAFCNIVRQAGGFAGFATCPEDFRKIIRK